MTRSFGTDALPPPNLRLQQPLINSRQQSNSRPIQARASAGRIGPHHLGACITTNDARVRFDGKASAQSIGALLAHVLDQFLLSTSGANHFFPVSLAGNPKRCIPDFVNAAFGKQPEVINVLSQCIGPINRFR